MAHTYEELHGMTVAQLRKVADAIEDDRLDGHATMHKQHLLHALCQVLNLDEHVRREVVGLDKSAVKARIRELKAERDEALVLSDRCKLKSIRRSIHRLKRQIRKATV